MHPIARTTVRVTAGGRIVIPVQVRRQLGIEVGAELVIGVVDDHATLASVKAARQRARDTIRRYVSPKERLSEELMRDRKLDAKHE